MREAHENENVPFKTVPETRELRNLCTMAFCKINFLCVRLDPKEEKMLRLLNASLIKFLTTIFPRLTSFSHGLALMYHSTFCSSFLTLAN